MNRSDASRTALGLLTAVVLALAFGSAAWAARNHPRELKSPCVSARIVHLEHVENDEGVATDTRFVERFYRCGDHVWVERVVPGAGTENARGERLAHVSPRMSGFARHVVRAEGEAIVGTLVRRSERMIVELDAAGLEAAGIGRSFEDTSQIVPWATVSTMSPTIVPGSASDGERAFTSTEGRRTSRARWSDSLGLVLEFESRTDDGTSSKRIIVEDLRSPPLEREPWLDTDGYVRRGLGEGAD
jgi:hypothetical protein